MPSTILGVRIDTISKTEALQRVGNFLNSSEPHFIFTPNPEMLVKATKDLYFKEILNKGDLNLCDARGLQLVIKKKVERIPGVDFMQDVAGLAEKNGLTIYLLGSQNDEVVLKTTERLKILFPALKIVGAHKGPALREKENFIPKNGENSLEIAVGEQKALLDDIRQAAPSIIFVAFGMGKQEKWIYENAAFLPSVRVFMGVGGSFDFISQKVKRAPCWMRKIGLEWVYRLWQEPRRILRIKNATVLFLFYFLFKK